MTTLDSATVKHDVEGLPLLSSAPSSPTLSACPRSTEQRVFYMIAERSSNIAHYDHPQSFYDGLRLASTFCRKTLDENTMVWGALDHHGKLGKCSSGFGSLCRVRQRLADQCCIRHEVMNYAERVGRVTEYWVLDHDPISGTNSSPVRAIPLRQDESWQSKQRSFEEQLSESSKSWLSPLPLIFANGR